YAARLLLVAVEEVAARVDAAQSLRAHEHLEGARLEREHHVRTRLREIRDSVIVRVRYVAERREVESLYGREFSRKGVCIVFVLHEDGALALEPEHVVVVRGFAFFGSYVRSVEAFTGERLANLVAVAVAAGVRDEAACKAEACGRYCGI